MPHAISAGLTERFSAAERYAASTTRRVWRLSSALVMGVPSVWIASINDAIGPMNASGIHKPSSAMVCQSSGLSAWR